ncbi:MAG: type II toxin-antitoxin system HicA family toxin [Planctomycetota bacterium]|nr:type II toxin-antitoxin system HicA family toxin [Planctomycetota bacterium]MDE1890124.1 type II toxin-antitoxin system HicA family toxin [Planctomycetota bacterium]MDE2216274.1 type II toxin-antitoxin system HicA family toxin [Planctomycetota bacterium]
MTNVPNLNYGQVINALRRDGWVIVRQKGSHIRLQKHTTERKLKLTFPAHNPIIKQAHLSVDEFTKLL